MYRNKILIIILLFVSIITMTLTAQSQKQTYIVELDTLIKLKDYTLSNGYLDLSKLISNKNRQDLKNNKRLLDVAEFLGEINPVSLRKFIRRLPEDITFLTTTSGKKFNVEGFQKLLVIEMDRKIAVNTINTKLKENNTVKKISADVKIKVSTWPPNDTDYSLQEQYYNNPYNIDLPRAWEYSSGNSGIKIGVVDNGIDYTHTDLGAGFGNGHRIRGGWDYKDNDSDPRPTYTTETHGTPIAGILGAINWNNTGVVGIAGGSSSSISSGCQIFSFRVTDEEVGDNGINVLQSALVAEAVFEASTDPSVNNGFGYGVNVINCSFGGLTGMYWDWGSLFYRSYYDSFVWAYLNNVVVTASRGNSGDQTITYPSDFSNGGVVLSVSGLFDSGNFATGSSWGNGVSISAPYYFDYTTRNNNSYGAFSGTSNSAPFVAGVSALVFSKFLERGVTVYGEDVQEILKISAEHENDELRYGAGRLDAGQALHISSEPFSLVHLTANDNRTVTTVSNPSSNKIALKYPYGLYVVAETKKITASIQIPDTYNLDSTWFWANGYTDGLEWGNPSYGMPNATLISQNGRNVTFESYVYKMMPIGGSSLYWYPTSPNEANIQVTILGKQIPPSATVYPTTNYVGSAKAGTYFTGSFTTTNTGGVTLNLIIQSSYWDIVFVGENSSYYLQETLSPGQSKTINYISSFGRYDYGPFTRTVRIDDNNNNIHKTHSIVGTRLLPDFCYGETQGKSASPEEQLFDGAFLGYFDFESDSIRYDKSKSIKERLSFAYDLLKQSKTEKVENICKLIIELYPESEMGISFYAMGLLWEASLSKEAPDFNEKDLTSYLKELTERKEKYKIYGYSQLILSLLDVGNDIEGLEKLFFDYEYDGLKELALFHQFIHYYVYKQDKETARKVSDQLDKMFVDSRYGYQAHLIFGDEGYTLDGLLELIKKKQESLLAKRGESKTDILSEMPTEYKLYNNYPNPFNPTTTIKYSVPKVSKVKLSVYNMMGQLIKTLVNETQAPGFYNVEWNGTNENNSSVASGIYFYRFESDNFVANNKMILIK